MRGTVAALPRRERGRLVPTPPFAPADAVLAPAVPFRALLSSRFPLPPSDIVLLSLALSSLAGALPQRSAGRLRAAAARHRRSPPDARQRAGARPRDAREGHRARKRRPSAGRDQARVRERRGGRGGGRESATSRGRADALIGSRSARPALFRSERAARGPRSAHRLRAAASDGRPRCVIRPSPSCSPLLPPLSGPPATLPRLVPCSA